MSERTPESVKKIIPFAPNKMLREEGDPMDRSGQAIIALLQQAADTANSNCERAMELAHKLSVQLRVAEDRIRELEADVQHFHDRAQRAEKWLVCIYKDIEEKFFDPQSDRLDPQSDGFDSQSERFDPQSGRFDAQLNRFESQSDRFDPQSDRFDPQSDRFEQR